MQGTEGTTPRRGIDTPQAGWVVQFVPDVV